MWLWQQKNIHKKQLLWAKLFLISFSFHCTFLLWLFFLCHDAGFDIAITVQNKLSDVPVIFVPFKQQKIVNIQNNVSRVQTTSVAAIKQKEPQTSIQKRKETKVKPKKEQTKKVVAKKEVKKNNDKKMQVAQKKKTPLQSKSIQPVKKEIKKQTTQNKQIKIAQATPQQQVVQTNYREIEAQRRQALLQKELANYFKPPIGVPLDCACQIKVVVDWNGVIQELVVTQSSGILMYDVAARSALYTMKMPSWSKGKSLTVTFRQ